MTRGFRRILVLLIAVTCVLGLPTVSAAEPDAGAAVDCPQGCACWQENGISKMSCSAPANEPAPRQQVEGNAVDAAHARRSPQQTRQVTGSVPDASAEQPWMTDDERLAALKQRQGKVEHSLLKAQRERFEARARGESAEELERIETSFADLKQQRWTILQKIGQLQPTE
jgi:hypothetical protein